ncbi:hypothetical protein V8F06_013575 [Rhypophila decipiens]
MITRCDVFVISLLFLSSYISLMPTGCSPVRVSSAVVLDEIVGLGVIIEFFQVREDGRLTGVPKRLFKNDL